VLWRFVPARVLVNWRRTRGENRESWAKPIFNGFFEPGYSETDDDGQAEPEWDQDRDEQVGTPVRQIGKQHGRNEQNNRQPASVKPSLHLAIIRGIEIQK